VRLIVDWQQKFRLLIVPVVHKINQDISMGQKKLPLDFKPVESYDKETVPEMHW
jgi:hypothetical protein